MQVGDLVRWENAGGEYELGMVTDLDGDGYVLIWFSYPDQDSDYMWESESELEVICK